MHLWTRELLTPRGRVTQLNTAVDVTPLLQHFTKRSWLEFGPHLLHGRRTVFAHVVCHAKVPAFLYLQGSDSDLLKQKEEQQEIYKKLEHSYIAGLNEKS